MRVIVFHVAAVLALATSVAACRLPSTFTPPRDGGTSQDGATSGPDAGDASTATDAATTDAGGALGPFGAPVLLTVLSDPAVLDDDPTLTADLLDIWFNSERNGGPGNGDVWTSTRATPSGPWSAPVVVPELSSPSLESTPEVSADGLTMMFVSDRAPTLGSVDVWVSTRNARGDSWGTPAQVVELSTPSSEGATALDPTTLFVVLHSNRPGGPGGLDLYTSARGSVVSNWTAPLPIAELNTADSEADAFESPIRLQIFFATDRPGGLGGTDIYLATRPSTIDLFGAPTAIVELNGPGNEADPWVSADLRHVFFYSDRTGNGELYESSR